MDLACFIVTAFLRLGTVLRNVVCTLFHVKRLQVRVFGQTHTFESCGDIAVHEIK